MPVWWLRVSKYFFCLPACLPVCLCTFVFVHYVIRLIDRTEPQPRINMFSLLQRLEYHTPMSFEQAVAMGRTGVLPSPILNGYKPKGLGGGLPSGRHSDSDEEDWC